MTKSEARRILEVDIHDNEQEIKQRYRKKAKEFHPDMSSGDPVKFKKIQRAYETLNSKAVEVDIRGLENEMFRTNKPTKTINEIDKGIERLTRKYKYGQKGKKK